MKHHHDEVLLFKKKKEKQLCVQTIFKAKNIGNLFLKWEGGGRQEIKIWIMCFLGSIFSILYKVIISFVLLRTFQLN